MQQLKDFKVGLQVFINTKISFILSLIFSLLLFTILCLIQNGGVSLQVFSFTTIPFFSKILFFFQTLFNVTTYFTPTTLSIAIIGSIFGGISITVTYIYFLIRKQAIDSGSFALTSLSYLLVIVGVQCATCSVVLASLLISLLGTMVGPTLLMSLPVWFGFVGILLQIVVLWLLLGKLSKSLIC